MVQTKPLNFMFRRVWCWEIVWQWVTIATICGKYIWWGNDLIGKRHGWRVRFPLSRSFKRISYKTRLLDLIVALPPMRVKGPFLGLMILITKSTKILLILHLHVMDGICWNLHCAAKRKRSRPERVRRRMQCQFLDLISDFLYCNLGQRIISYQGSCVRSDNSTGC